jgi:D-glycero-D-manno-heptose 1,7-bisphosphate phosphatase
LTSHGAVFFDRDGVLIETLVEDGAPIADNNVDSLKFISGAVEVCESLAVANIKMFMITNQPDISRGKVLLRDVLEINDEVMQTCRLTDTSMCVHDDDENCSCRKPKPGMILELSAKHHIDLGRSVVVGDRWRDIDAGANAGCMTIFIDYGYNETLRTQPTWKVSTMSQAGLILRKHFGIDERGE